MTSRPRLRRSWASILPARTGTSCFSENCGLFSRRNTLNKGSVHPSLILEQAAPGAAPGEDQFERVPVRVMFTDTDDSELVQVQNSAFLRNWRKTVQNQPYTHYNGPKA